MDSKLKYLEMILGIITRMGSNSFLIKGWSVTLVSALLAIAVSNSRSVFACMAFFPCLIFWILDGYYLRQERLYRELYQSVAKSEKIDSNFSMNALPHENNIVSWLAVCLSKTLLIFHGMVLAVIGVVALVV